MLLVTDLRKRHAGMCHFYVRLFADNTVLYHRISLPADTADLQHDIDALQAWECKWLMEFNPSKSQVLRVMLKHKPVEASYMIHSTRAG